MLRKEALPSINKKYSVGFLQATLYWEGHELHCAKYIVSESIVGTINLIKSHTQKNYYRKVLTLCRRVIVVTYGP